MKKTRFFQHDQTEKLYATSRQEGTYLYITSQGDDIENGKVGEGTALVIDNSDNQSEVIIETSFLEDVFIKDGIVFWENAVIGDHVTLDIVLPAGMSYELESETGNFTKDENGDLVSVTSSQVPDETWTGDWLILPMDYTLFRYVNKFRIIGTNHHGTILESNDTAKLDKNLKLRFIMKSESNNPAKAIVNLKLYRTTTI